MSAAPRERVSRAGRPATRPDDQIVDLVRQLGAALGELGLTEIEVQQRGLRLRLQRTPAGPPTLGATPGLPGIAAPASPVALDAVTHLVTVEAPMVGTFYRASSPTADPYAREGELVKPGQILCIIEAMKLMNEIESKMSGRIAKILVENGQAVEYGQPLFLIDPR